MRRSIYLLTALTAGTVSMSNSAFAQPDHWESTGGPLVGAINVLWRDGDTIFAGTRHGGIFESDDFGATWSRLGAPYLSEFVSDFAKNSAGNLFAATSKGVRRSTDGGQTWDLLTDGLPTRPSVNAIGVGDDDALIVATSSGVFRSFDDGVSWTESNIGASDKFTRSVTFDLDGIVYVGTNHGVIASNDKGETWHSIGLESFSIFEVRQASGVGLNLWAAGISGVFHYTGGQWTEPLTTELFGFTYESGVLYAGGINKVWISSNEGVSWSENTLDLDTFSEVWTVRPLSDTGLLAGTDSQGIYRSFNGGAGWVRANNGLDAGLIDDLDADASGRLFAASPGGVFRSLDGGNSWDQRLGLVGARTVRAFSSGTLLAGTIMGGIYRSTNGGEMWSATDPKLVYLIAGSFAEAPNGHLFAGVNAGIIYRSVDDGVTWDSVGFAGNYLEVGAMAAASDGTIYAGWEQGVLRSVDDGATWEEASNGLPENLSPYGFLFLPSGDILISSQQGVYRSGDAGDNWILSGTVPLIGGRDIVRDSDGTIYCAVNGQGVAVSMDGALNWAMVVSGLSTLGVTSLAIIPATSKGGTSANDQVYVASRGAGVAKLAFSTLSVGDENPEGTRGLRLGSNYPNPFHGSTSIPIELDHAGIVRLTMFDVLGRQVRLENLQLPAGNQDVRLDASDLAPGMYLFEATAAGVNVTGTMVKK